MSFHNVASLADRLKIRNKRLAKLGSQAPTQPISSEEGGSTDGPALSQAPSSILPAPSEKEPSKPTINISGSSSRADSPQNPFSQLGLKQSNGEAPRINITSSAGRPVTPQKRDRPASSGKRPSSRSGETSEQWEDRALGNLFKFSLDQDHRLDSHGNSITFLNSTRQELDETNEPIRLSTGLLDQAILETASNLKQGTTLLDYLLGCWKRVNRQYKLLRKAGEQDPKFMVVKEARRLCMSYCIFAVTMPDMFG